MLRISQVRTIRYFDCKAHILMIRVLTCYLVFFMYWILFHPAKSKIYTPLDNSIMTSIGRLKQMRKKVSLVLQAFLHSANKKSHLYLAEKRFMDVLFKQVCRQLICNNCMKWPHSPSTCKEERKEGK